MSIRHLLGCTAVLFLTAIQAASAQVALGETALPEPHSSCESEPTRVSTEGVTESQLTVVNNTDATFGLYWLDYEGERVFYQDAPPHTSQIQDTWLTHPWILADPDGTCYLLIVITSQRQTMTIGSTTGEEPVTPIETTVPPTTTSATTAGTQPANPTTSQPGLSSEQDPGFPTPLVVGALAMMGVLVGVLAAQGRFSRSPGKQQDR
jgi:hypothetical protein